MEHPLGQTLHVEPTLPCRTENPAHCLWEGDLLRLGLFIAPPDHDLFRDSGPIRGSNVVFPRTPLRISWANGRARWSDRTNLNFYNDGDEFTRTAVDSEGDRCLWVEPQPLLLTQLADHLKGGRREVERRPFQHRQAPGDLRLSRAMLELVGYLRESLNREGSKIPVTPDPLVVEEEAMAILEGALWLHRKRSSVRAEPDPPSMRWVDSAQELLAETFTENTGLESIAGRVGCSPYHLARNFRAATGTTLHRRRLHLRLDAAVERLLQGESEISRLAFELGFSSHSHFTSTFRRHLRATPSAVRQGRLPSTHH